MSRHLPTCAQTASIALLTLAVLVAPSSADILYIGQGYAPPNHIWSYDTDSTGNTLTTLSSSEPGQMVDMHIDPATNRMYWVVNGWDSVTTGWVRAANLDGSNPVTLRQGPANGNVGGIAVDAANGVIYYASSRPYANTQAHTGIVRINLDGSNPLNIITSTGAPRGVEIDPVNGRIYWSEYNQGIKSANFNGADIYTVIQHTTANPVYVSDIELDLTRGLIYWASGSAILRAPIGALSTPQQVIGNVKCSSLALSPDGNTIYYGDTNAERIYQLDFNGTNHQLTAYANNPFALEAIIPEPMSLTLLALGAALLHRSRKRPT